MSILKNKTPQTFSPFWPVFCVFISVGILQGLNVIDDVHGRKDLLDQQAAIQQLLPRAKTVDKSVEEISNELLLLSEVSHDQEAAKIISDFGISRNANATNAPAKK